METKKQPSRILTDRLISFLLNLYYYKQSNIITLARSVGITYDHAHKEIFPKLYALGLVEHEKRGRERLLRLTPKGLEVSKRFAEIGELLGEPINETKDKRLDLIC